MQRQEEERELVSPPPHTRTTSRDGVVTSGQILSPLTPIVQPAASAEERAWKHCWN